MLEINNNNINICWSSLLIEELVRNGINYFCLSPGSRSAPLAISAARNKKARTIICYDERGASYHAVGYARAQNRPAVLICTSGTAACNYYPAIAEASADQVPLIVLTADRPPELRDTGANQTIDQVNLFGKYTRWFADMPCPDEKIPPEYVLAAVDRAVFLSQRTPAGPVHLNCMFREPLVPAGKSQSTSYLNSIKQWQNSSSPYTAHGLPCIIAPARDVLGIANILNRAKKGLIVAGQLATAAEQLAVRKFAIKLNWPVLADIQSGLRLGSDHLPVLQMYDSLLASKRFVQKAVPDTIIHFGGRVTSKAYLKLIKAQSRLDYIMVSNNPSRVDPEHKLTFKVETHIPAFCKMLSANLKPSINKKWRDYFTGIASDHKKAVIKYLSQKSDISEPAVAAIVSQEITKETCLFLGSSMPIRDMDRFGTAAGHSVRVAGNRGVSGIDGTIASTSGYAAGTGKPVTLIIGDMAFLHDMNSLTLVNLIKQPLIIVVINNHGGGIFSFLPVAECNDVFEPFFMVPHNYTFKDIAAAFGIQYFNPETQDLFRHIYKQSIKQKISAIIEVNTDINKNLEVHKELDNIIVNY
ncbi:MAG: 2-succinyl-5-enolpyruvyl-6-hydroxy-3-cyclohexene-1-carboxylic-acid synthase [bacterium]